MTGISDYRSLLLAGTPLIDVRAPVEFKRGAIPGALNLPLMTDDERHQVGLRYKQAGQDSAIELGARLIPPAERQLRTERWLSFAKANPHGALYCFRGGLRSRITQQWLADAGCEYPLVNGGYKALRSWILATLMDLSTCLNFVLLGGRTGSGKTLLIKRLAYSIDLEGLAHHRGSSFGNMADAQPSNIDFENDLTTALLKMNEAGISTVFLEDEARMIGRVCVPEPVRDAMQASPAIILETSLETRIEHAVHDYVLDLLSRYRQQTPANDSQTEGSDDNHSFDKFAAHHRGSLSRIQKRLGGENHSHALEMLDAALSAHREHNDIDGYRPFIEFMLTRYYDPMYDYQLAQKQRRIIFTGDAEAIYQWISHQYKL